jgi:cytochrome c553
MTVAACLIPPLRGAVLQGALRAVPALVLLCLAIGAALPAAGQAIAETDGAGVSGREAYVGTATCAGCHEAETAAWPS